MRYYRQLMREDLLHPDQDGDAFVPKLDCMIRPVEVNEWHPASEEPKPEDFEPYKRIILRDLHGGIGWLWRDDFNEIGGLPRYATHWLKITPPNGI